MLLHKSVEHDSRVRREAKALQDAGHEVTVVHLPRRRDEVGRELDGFRVVAATPASWVRERIPFALYRLVFLAAFVREVLRLRPDVVHAHDCAMLLPGFAAARLLGARLVYDSHEYAAGVPYRERSWALFVTTLERMLIGRCSAVVTVSDGIASRLQARSALPVAPAVVRNTPDPTAYGPEIEVSALRERIAADGRLVIHLGAVARDRGCHTLVRSLRHLDESFHLLFLGADDAEFAAGLVALARADGTADRLSLRRSVPVSEVLAYASQADVGVSLLEDTCENHRLALPNKVFEYMAAGVPVVASDLPELRRTLGSVEGVSLANPTDPRDVATGVERAASGPRPIPGLFTWSSDARRLVELYSRLPGSPERSRTAPAASATHAPS